jgi:hypothetical protein
VTQYILTSTNVLRNLLSPSSRKKSPDIVEDRNLEFDHFFIDELYSTAFTLPFSIKVAYILKPKGWRAQTEIEPFNSTK